MLKKGGRGCIHRRSYKFKGGGSGQRGRIVSMASKVEVIVDNVDSHTMQREVTGLRRKGKHGVALQEEMHEFVLNLMALER